MAHIVKLDHRYVYGARCAWHGSIKEIGLIGGRIPCCPHCKGVLYEVPTAKDWWDMVDAAEPRIPGYRKFVEWLHDHHFYDPRDATVVYKLETGIEIKW